MGQYYKGNKIGTCENMYYLTREEAERLAAQGQADDDGITFKEYLTDNETCWRFPWPGNDEKKEPFRSFDVPCSLPTLLHGDKVVYMSLPSGGYGFNVFFPCPYSKDFTLKTSTGGAGRVFLSVSMEVIRDGAVHTLFKCPHCGKSQYFDDPAELAALKKEALEYYSVYNHENGNKGLYEYAVKIINLIK